MLLSGKVAIIIGAARGIGRACAKRFAREGAKVVLADTDEARGRYAAAALVGAGAEASFVVCDVGNSSQISGLITASLDAYGGVDVLVNNAGILHAADFLEVTEYDFDRLMRVNLKGPFLVGQAAARQMVDGGWGSAIVNLSSIGAVLAALYSAAVQAGARGTVTPTMASRVTNSASSASLMSWVSSGCIGRTK